MGKLSAQCGTVSDAAAGQRTPTTHKHTRAAANICLFHFTIIPEPNRLLFGGS